MSINNKCKICGNKASKLGIKKGKYSKIDFEIYRCSECFFTYVANPWLEYDKIYDYNYYQGLGADPKINFKYEQDFPDKTIRQYEWRGILKVIQSYESLDSNTKWLDFGCGNGSLIQYCQTRTNCNMYGSEEGWIKEIVLEKGLPLIDLKDIHKYYNTFDVITAIEVLEHIEDPIGALKNINKLLKPNGLFFYTTGNAEPHRDNILEWSYLVPEIHISLYEPNTLEIALQKSGFQVEYSGYSKGITDIIRYKILKNIGVTNANYLEKLLPWGMISRIVNKKHKVTDHPISRKIGPK